MDEFQYISKKDIVKSEKYPFTIGVINHFLMHRNENGLNIAVRKIGRRIYFRSDLLDNWIEKHNDTKETNNG